MFNRRLHKGNIDKNFNFISSEKSLLLKKLENNWKTGFHIHTSFYMNQTVTKNNDFDMNDRWIFKALANGRISIRNRWAPEAEHVGTNKIFYWKTINHHVKFSIIDGRTVAKRESPF